MNSKSSTGIIRSMLRAFGRQATGQPIPSEIDLAFAAPSDAWRKAINVLDIHRVTGMMGAAMSHEDTLGNIPPDAATYLREAADVALKRNVLRLEYFFKTLHVLRAEDAEPTLLKSAGMAARFPTLLAHNQMSDVDLYIPPDRLHALETALERCDFVKTGEETSDAVYFNHEPSGLLLDIHHRFRIFEHLDFESVTRVVPVSLPAGETAKVLTPEAELVHLVCHENGHRAPHGYCLRWLIDQFMLLVEEGGLMNTDKLDNAAPDEMTGFWIARLLGFIKEEFDVDLHMEAFPELIQGFRLEEVLASRRHASFPLNKLSAWKTLIGCLTGLRSLDSRTYPAPFDYFSMRTYAREEAFVKKAWLAVRP